MHSSIASLLLVLVTPVAQAGQPSETPPQAVSQPRDATAQRRLVVTYSDGKTSTQLLRPKGGFWIPKFPRQANPPLHDGLPLAALQVDFETGRELVVTVSLKYGTPHQKTVPLTTVRLGTEPVRVNDLERYGSIRSCSPWTTFLRHRSCSRRSRRRRRCSTSPST